MPETQYIDSIREFLVYSGINDASAGAVEIFTHHYRYDRELTRLAHTNATEMAIAENSFVL